MNDKIIETPSMLSVGTVLHGTYRIEKYLASGGFGNTYEVTHILLGERRAIKEFFLMGVTQRDGNSIAVSVSNEANISQVEEQKKKFEKEARRLRKIDNCHVVKVYDLFEENNTVYYVMDFIDGESLSEMLKRTGEPLKEDVVLGYIPQILDALLCVHNKNIWHLDLKPGNIMVDKTGRIRLIDFGSSKQLKQGGGATTTTVLSYTPGYAPREQMEQSLEKFGPWTDFYALGATIYNLLTMNIPPKPSDIDDDGDKAYQFTSNVSENMRDFILWLMQPNRSKRPQTVEEIYVELKNKSFLLDDGVKLAASEDLSSNGDGKDDNNDDHTRIMIDSQADNTDFNKFGTGSSDEDDVIVTETGGEKSSPKQLPFVKILIGFIVGLVVIFMSYYFYTGKMGNKVSNVDSMSVDTVESKFLFDVPELGSCYYVGTTNANGKPNGYGEATFNNGNTFKGNWLNGYMVKGIFKYKENGDVYEGKFVYNAFSDGKITFGSDGNYFIGLFVNGQPDYKHGHEYNKNGKLLK
jgi:serine/threonine protein kinase